MTAVVTVNTRRGKARVVDFDAVTLRQELNRKDDRDEVQRSLPRHEHYTPSTGWAKRLMISWPIDQWTLVPAEDWAHLIPADVTPDVVDKRGVCWKAHDGFAKVTPARGVIGTLLEHFTGVRVVFLDTHMVSSAWSGRRVPSKAWRKRKWLAHKRLLDHITEALTAAGFLVALGGDFNRGVTLDFPGLVNPRQTKPAGIEAYDQLAASPDLDPRDFGRAGGKAGSDHYPQQMTIGQEAVVPSIPTSGPHQPKRRFTDSSGRGVWASDYEWGRWEAVVFDVGFRPVITQGPWQKLNPGGGAPNSAGYHDYGGTFDLRVKDLTDEQVGRLVRSLRRAGCVAWLRNVQHGGFTDPHIHFVMAGAPNLSSGATWQVSEYRIDNDGLSSRGPDYHWRPSPLVLSPTEEMFMPTADEIANATRSVVREEVAKALTGVPDAVWDHRLKVQPQFGKNKGKVKKAGVMLGQTDNRTSMILGNTIDLLDDTEEEPTA